MMPCGKAKKPRIQSKMRGFLLEQAQFQWGMTPATSFVQEVDMGSSSAKRLVVQTVNPLDELSVGFGREEPSFRSSRSALRISPRWL